MVGTEAQIDTSRADCICHMTKTEAKRGVVLIKTNALYLETCDLNTFVLLKKLWYKKLQSNLYTLA